MRFLYRDTRYIWTNVSNKWRLITGILGFILFEIENSWRLEEGMKDKDTLCPAALRAARKRANGKRGFTQGQLAERIGCSKDTVSRWERGKSHRVRTHLREPLCKALGVEWDTLTTPPGPEAVPRPFGLTRMQRWVSRHVPSALRLVAERYGIRPNDVLDIAPLLFLIVAERSLLERRRRLDEIYATQEEADRRVTEKSAHLGGVIVARRDIAEEMLEEEEKSLRERDIFGRLIEYAFRGDDDKGPFVHFVDGLAEGLPQGAVTEIDSYGGDTILSYQIAEDTLRECTGLSGDEEEAEILEYIQSGEVDLGECLRARRERDEADYRQWLRDSLAEAKEAFRRELIEKFGESALTTVAESGASATQEREGR